MRAKRKSFSDIADIFAFRIIVDSVDACYERWRHPFTVQASPRRIQRLHCDPKANGYQSLYGVGVRE